jgi:hypothetical protein
MGSCQLRQAFLPAAKCKVVEACSSLLLYPKGRGILGFRMCRYCVPELLVRIDSLEAGAPTGAYRSASFEGITQGQMGALAYQLSPVKV